MILSRNSSEADSYYQLVKSGRVFIAQTAITGLVAYSTAAGIGGPLLWNNTGQAAGGLSRVMAVVIGLSVGWTTAPAAAGVIGLTFGTGQTSAPTSTATITGVANIRPDIESEPLCNVYNSGTVANAGEVLIETHQVGTGTVSSQPLFVPLDGLIQVPPGCWAAVAGATAIATMVGQISLVFAEVPF
jgi:hypothetical protein